MTTAVLNSKPVSVRLPQALLDRVETLAQTSRRSRGDVVREALEREIDQLEWEYRIAARAADARAGRTKLLDADQVDRMLGLENEPVPDDALSDVS